MTVKVRLQRVGDLDKGGYLWMHGSDDAADAVSISFGIAHFPALSDFPAQWIAGEIVTPFGVIKIGNDVAEKFATEFLRTLWPERQPLKLWPQRNDKPYAEHPRMKEMMSEISAEYFLGSGANDNADDGDAHK